MDVLSHHVVHRLTASLKGLWTQTAVVKLLWDRVGLKCELYSVVWWTDVVLVFAFRIAQQQLVTVARENLVKLIAIILVELISQVLVKLLVCCLLQVNVEWVEEENFVLYINIVERGRHEVLIEMISKRCNSLKLFVANLTKRSDMT